MAKDRFLYKSVLLLVFLIISSTSMAEEKIKIRSMFDINNMFCAIKTNGVLGMDNRDFIQQGDNILTSSTNTMLVLENGVNDITLEVGALGWFSNEISERKDKETFSSDATCKVALTLFNGEKRNTLTQMKISIDKNGAPITGASTPTGNNIVAKKIASWQIEKGHIESDYFIDNYFPEGMVVYQFTQQVSLKGLPEWRWVKATPFTGKPEQVLALQNAYAELWRLFASKDQQKIKNKMSVALKAWSVATGSEEDSIFNNYYFVDAFKNKDFKMVPINWNNYKVEITNKGRLVKFVNKSDPTVSPFAYKIIADDGETEFNSFAPFFSLVDGKFIPML